MNVDAECRAAVERLQDAGPDREIAPIARAASLSRKPRQRASPKHLD